MSLLAALALSAVAVITPGPEPRAAARSANYACTAHKSAAEPRKPAVHKSAARPRKPAARTPTPGKSARPRKVKNMPTGWTWPPSPAMKRAGERCLARLDAAGIAHAPAKPVKKVATPILLPAMSIGDVALVSLKGPGPHTLDCHLADALAVVAPDLRALGVTELHFRTLHKYRGVRRKGVSRRVLSRHAVGLAVDVFEVAFADGEVLVVKRHWRASGRRLARVAEVFEQSPAFRTPLTPSNDPADHDDHLHLEAHMRLDP